MNLENLNLVELNALEGQEVDGGIVPLVILAYVGYGFLAGFAAGVTIGTAVYLTK
ncbi:hypothetical protein [Flavobacterium sp. ACAM 123]|uniref:hypothetical protein n=1 Tax=Flavobacterium sp. ACAM 123 TaxID=1189620 RepID=UPI0002D481DC|nr:hypothetical protein [Flavobacterium sp. ACAM 123]